MNVPRRYKRRKIRNERTLEYSYFLQKNYESPGCEGTFFLNPALKKVPERWKGGGEQWSAQGSCRPCEVSFQVSAGWAAWGRGQIPGRQAEGPLLKWGQLSLDGAGGAG